MAWSIPPLTCSIEMVLQVSIFKRKQKNSITLSLKLLTKIDLVRQMKSTIALASSVDLS